MRLKHIQQWCPCSHFIASFALSSLQKSCHHFIWTQLFPPLAPRVMTFLFQPEQRSHSTFSIVGWKLISSRGMSCHPLGFPSVCVFSLWFYLPWGEKISPELWFPELGMTINTITESRTKGHWGQNDFDAYSLCSSSALCFFLLIWMFVWY